MFMAQLTTKQLDIFIGWSFQGVIKCFRDILLLQTCVIVQIKYETIALMFKRMLKHVWKISQWYQEKLQSYKKKKKKKQWFSELQHKNWACGSVIQLSGTVAPPAVSKNERDFGLFSHCLGAGHLRSCWGFRVLLQLLSLRDCSCSCSGSEGKFSVSLLFLFLFTTP